MGFILYSSWNELVNIGTLSHGQTTVVDEKLQRNKIQDNI